uniref:Uncharacterized protein n=1 Tax=Amphimedon queenslandica TaxID=400682 RepID=A0A1X7UNV3_AMPQE
GIYACGTIRSNRKNFPLELTPYLKRGFPKRGHSVTLQSEILPILTISVSQDTKLLQMSVLDAIRHYNI